MRWILLTVVFSDRKNVKGIITTLTLTMPMEWQDARIIDRCGALVGGIVSEMSVFSWRVEESIGGSLQEMYKTGPAFGNCLSG